ncbi:MAG TPA: aldo/keto reductase [Bryobacteraceae bacterium]|nr:aldo/keto reductase [Bryobacteraceae bacterium]
MRYRKLGRTEIEVSEIGYGAWGIGGKMWLGGNDGDAIAALRRALDLGLNFIDTAFVYGEGHSEELIGQHVPREIHVATKIPPKNMLWPARPGIGIKEVFPYDHVMRCTEESLRRLKRDSVDLQQFHVWNPEWIDSDEWRRAFEDLEKSGKAKNTGVSLNNHQPDSALDLVRTGLCDTVQVIYNIFDQSPEVKLFPLCLELGIGVLARVPLDEGALTGRINQQTVFEPGDFRERYFRENRRADVVNHVSALQDDLKGFETEGTLPQIALRFCLSDAAVSTVIPGMRSIPNVEANCAVSDKGTLPLEVLAILKQHAWEKDYYAGW